MQISGSKLQTIDTPKTQTPDKTAALRDEIVKKTILFLMNCANKNKDGKPIIDPVANKDLWDKIYTCFYEDSKTGRSDCVLKNLNTGEIAQLMELRANMIKLSLKIDPNAEEIVSPLPNTLVVGLNVSYGKKGSLTAHELYSYEESEKKNFDKGKQSCFDQDLFSSLQKAENSREKLDICLYGITTNPGGVGGTSVAVKTEVKPSATIKFKNYDK